MLLLFYERITFDVPHLAKQMSVLVFNELCCEYKALWLILKTLDLY